MKVSALDTGYTDVKLADFIEGLIAKYPRFSMDYWRTALRNNDVTGSHQWNNLETLISSIGQLYACNVSLPVLYCKQRGTGVIK